MSRNSLLLVMLFTVSFFGFLGHSYLLHPQAAAEVTSVTLDALPSVQRASATAASQAVILSEATSLQTPPRDSLEKLIAEAFDDDPGKRATAIAALATAPRLQAVPVLQKVLNTGEPEVDRPLALRSLRILALQQGDADGDIRDVFRQAIYDGKYEAITPDAQAALNDVESHLD